MSAFKKHFPKRIVATTFAAALLIASQFAFASAYLEITLKVDPADRPAAAAVYTKYKQPFLKTIAGAEAKELLVRDNDVQVLHRFATAFQAETYLKSDLFNKDVVSALKPLLKAAPEVRIYDVH